MLFNGFLSRVLRGSVVFAIALTVFFNVAVAPAAAWSLGNFFRAFWGDATEGTAIEETTVEETAPAFTLQLLHASDFEAGLEALDDAPRFSAVLNALKDDFPNTLILSSGDNYIPSPFLFASGDPSLNDTPVGKAGIGHANIEIHNRLGIQASTVGNHDFDLGPQEVSNMTQPSGAYRGAVFPYLSTNLDFAPDPDLAGQVTADGQALSTLAAGQFAGNAIAMVGGEQIGLVGATTPLLPAIAAVGEVGVQPKNDTDYDALAADIQTAVDTLTATGIDKVILLSHMQQLNIERDELARRLRDVDILVAGGSHTLLADETDRLRAGDMSAGTYPILKTDADGKPIAVVNTKANYTYVGRLVVDFDADGFLIPESIDATVSGAYATDEEGVNETGGTPDSGIVEIVDALNGVIRSQDSNIFGNTTVFLRGDRTYVRTEETNLGNLTADADLAAAQAVDANTRIALKNGGGIRSNIGVISAASGSTDPNDFELLPPAANPEAGKAAGEVSQLDITNSLRFNNGLTLITLTAEQLLQTLEHSVSGTAPGATPGQFPQVGGLRFSFEPERPAFDRVRSLVVLGKDEVEVVVQAGELVSDPNRTFRTITTSYLAGGGDSYPFPSFLSTNPTLFDRVDFLGEPDSDGNGKFDPEEDLNQNGVQDAALVEPCEGVADFASFGSEQDSLAEYFHQAFPTTDSAYSLADVEPALDERIQNLSVRADTVLPQTQP